MQSRGRVRDSSDIALYHRFHRPGSRDNEARSSPTSSYCDTHTSLHLHAGDEDNLTLGTFYPSSRAKAVGRRLLSWMFRSLQPTYKLLCPREKMNVILLIAWPQVLLYKKKHTPKLSKQKSGCMWDGKKGTPSIQVTSDRPPVPVRRQWLVKHQKKTTKENG